MTFEAFGLRCEDRGTAVGAFPVCRRHGGDGWLRVLETVFSIALLVGLVVLSRNGSVVHSIVVRFHSRLIVLYRHKHRLVAGRESK